MTNLPKNRLIIADIFPGETVEFSFTGVSALDDKCFGKAKEAEKAKREKAVRQERAKLEADAASAKAREAEIQRIQEAALEWDKKMEPALEIARKLGGKLYFTTRRTIGCQRPYNFGVEKPPHCFDIPISHFLVVTGEVAVGSSTWVSVKGNNGVVQYTPKGSVLDAETCRREISYHGQNASRDCHLLPVPKPKE